MPDFFTPSETHDFNTGHSTCGKLYVMALNESHPALLLEWDYEKNVTLGLHPEDFTYGSSQVVWWKCEERNHSFARAIATRTVRSYGCPECKKLKNGSFAENHPAQAALWDYEKNGQLTPDAVSSSNQTVVWWKCEHEHEWEQKISLVSAKDIPCTVCSRVRNGSLASKHPEVAQFWHPTLNEELTPEWVAAKSNQKVHWQCEQGHEWVAPPNRLVTYGKGCPECSRAKESTYQRKSLISESPLAAYWDETKNAQFGWDATEVRLGSDKHVFWKCERGHEWQMRVSVFAKKDGCPECSLGGKTAGGYTRHHSLSVGLPEVASEWHPTLNGILTPSDVSTASGKLVWWLCSEGHEYQNSVSNRTFMKQGCRICSHLRSGRTVANSDIASEWHPTLNGSIDPAVVVASSANKVWWICVNGHEYESTPRTRIFDGGGCKQCYYLRNGSLATEYPELASEWHPTLNGENVPSECSPYSSQRVWWLCSEDDTHKWLAPVGNRTGLKSGCPHCYQAYSQTEKEVVEFLREHGVTVDENKRDLFAGRKLEVDLFLPDYSIAIEFNGIYYHSEAFGKGRNSHTEKLELCDQLNIRLIQVWEDDWRFRQNIVKQGLLHRLGLSTQPRISARKTRVEQVSKSTAQSFLDENHIQGFTTGSLYLGLVEKGSPVSATVAGDEEPVAVVVFTVRGTVAYLERYATNAVVVGGFTKLLTHAERLLQDRGVTELVTFADRSLSQGDLYERSGWVVDKVLKPDYMYLVGLERKHKFGYRLKRFKNDPSLKYEEGLTESELAALNNLPRIWDAGKIRYVKELR